MAIGSAPLAKQSFLAAQRKSDRDPKLERFAVRRSAPYPSAAHCQDHRHQAP